MKGRLVKEVKRMLFNSHLYFSDRFWTVHMQTCLRSGNRSAEEILLQGKDNLGLNKARLSLKRYFSINISIYTARHL